MANKKVQDTYGTRFDFDVDQAMNVVKNTLKEKNPFKQDRDLKAWLLTPGVMVDYFKEYSEIDIHKRPAYSTIADMEKYLNLYTRPMRLMLSMYEDEPPLRIAQYKGLIEVVNYLTKYYHRN